uniref:Uncharacterized protein n=1 Tax=Romanomermis culicivorax TaxID=13658 RepID=A0A915HLF6_ROMCU
MSDIVVIVNGRKAKIMFCGGDRISTSLLCPNWLRSFPIGDQTGQRPWLLVEFSDDESDLKCQGW